MDINAVTKLAETLREKIAVAWDDVRNGSRIDITACIEQALRETPEAFECLLKVMRTVSSDSELAQMAHDQTQSLELLDRVLAKLRAQFTCGCCYETFTRVISEAEATAERQRDFPGHAQADCVEICEGCYKKFMAWYRTDEVTVPPTDGIPS